LSVTEELEDVGLFRDFNRIMSSLGWEPIEIDGHNYDEIITSLQKSRISKKPTIILANTIKGKGISFMENNIKWHGAIPSKEEVEIARVELNQGE
jgi:transketolase